MSVVEALIILVRRGDVERSMLLALQISKRDLIVRTDGWLAQETLTVVLWVAAHRRE